MGAPGWAGPARRGIILGEAASPQAIVWASRRACPSDVSPCLFLPSPYGGGSTSVQAPPCLTQRDIARLGRFRRGGCVGKTAAFPRTRTVQMAWHTGHSTFKMPAWVRRRSSRSRFPENPHLPLDSPGGPSPTGSRAGARCPTFPVAVGCAPAAGVAAGAGRDADWAGPLPWSSSSSRSRWAAE